MKRQNKPAISLAPDTPAQNESGPPAEWRILVVDDDASVREMLRRVLVGEGYSVCAAASGIAALEIAAVNPVDLVLLDLNMPGKSGWDTFKMLTAKNPLLPVVIVTARSNQLFTALSAGVGALLEKPLHFPRLLRPSGNCSRNPPPRGSRGWPAARWISITRTPRTRKNLDHERQCHRRKSPPKNRFPKKGPRRPRPGVEPICSGEFSGVREPVPVGATRHPARAGELSLY